MTNPAIGPNIPGYRFVRPLGRGGYADVYEYEQDVTRQRVAVKVLRVEAVSDLTMRMFDTEAQSMARLATHPFIVKVFQAGFASDGRPYLVMQYYPPPHLGKRAPLGTPQVLRTGIHLASAVETAHRAGILHRDVKPANILVDDYGAPGLTDFGIAGDARQAEDDGSAGVSIPWSPPEVLNGTSHGSVQADVYSLGATLWHLLVGRSPFWLPNGDNSERALVARILTTPAPATGKAVPPQLELLLQQVMAKDPGRRPRTAYEFARALQAIEAQERFARTDIAVISHAKTAFVAEEPTPEAPATSLRAPRVVVPTPPPPAPTPPVDMPPAPSHRGTGSVAPRLDPLAGTRLRPTVVEPVAVEAEPVPAPKQRSVKPWQVAMAAVLIIGATVGVGVAIHREAGSSDPTPSTSITGGPQVNPGDLAKDAGPLSITVGTPRGNRVTFSWQYDNSLPTDKFIVVVTPGGTSKTISTPSIDVRTRAGTQTCVEVTVFRPNANVQPSASKCIGST